MILLCFIRSQIFQTLKLDSKSPEKESSFFQLSTPQKRASHLEMHNNECMNRRTHSKSIFRGGTLGPRQCCTTVLTALQDQTEPEADSQVRSEQLPAGALNGDLGANGEARRSARVGSQLILNPGCMDDGVGGRLDLQAQEDTPTLLPSSPHPSPSPTEPLAFSPCPSPLRSKPLPSFPTPLNVNVSFTASEGTVNVGILQNSILLFPSFPLPFSQKSLLIQHINLPHQWHD